MYKIVKHKHKEIPKFGTYAAYNFLPLSLDNHPSFSQKGTYSVGLLFRITYFQNFSINLHTEYGVARYTSSIDTLTHKHLNFELLPMYKIKTRSPLSINIGPGIVFANNLSSKLKRLPVLLGQNNNAPLKKWNVGYSAMVQLSYHKRFNLNLSYFYQPINTQASVRPIENGRIKGVRVGVLYIF